MGERLRAWVGRTSGWVALLPMLAAAQGAPEPYEDSIALSDDAAETVPQAPDAAVATPVETLVVYGEKLGRTLTETASSVGIATREDLAAGTAADLRAVATQFGNVVAAGGDREIAIRGIPLTGIGGEGETTTGRIEISSQQDGGAYRITRTGVDTAQLTVADGPVL